MLLWHNDGWYKLCMLLYHMSCLCILLNSLHRLRRPFCIIGVHPYIAYSLGPILCIFCVMVFSLPAWTDPGYLPRSLTPRFPPDPSDTVSTPETAVSLLPNLTRYSKMSFILLRVLTSRLLSARHAILFVHLEHHTAAHAAIALCILIITALGLEQTWGLETTFTSYLERLALGYIVSGSLPSLLRRL